MFRLAYFVSHPIQYQAPLLRRIAADPEIRLKVFFYSDFSLREYHDPGFGRTFQWDIPLTQGYEFQVLKRISSKGHESVSRFLPARGIETLLRQGRFDAVWVHGWAHICSLQAICAAHRLRIPVLLRGDTSGLGKSDQPLKKWAKKRFLKWLFSKIRGFMATGKLNRQFYELRGVPPDRIFLMPHAVDNDFFRTKAGEARAACETLRRSLRLEAGRPVILFAAKLISVKRPLDLLSAYRLLSQDGVSEPAPYLLWMGDGVLRTNLERQSAVTGWNSIRFLGFKNQSELPAFYNLCDVFVLPSAYEPWGLVINEVMNAGKALVVSDEVGCAPDLVQDGVNGKVFQAGNVSQLAGALRWALDHAEIAGQSSLRKIEHWSFTEDMEGLKQAITTLC